MSETTERLLQEAEKHVKSLLEENRQLRVERDNAMKLVDDASMKVSEAEVELNRMQGSLKLQSKISEFQKQYLSLLDMAKQLDAQVNPKTMLDIQQRLVQLSDTIPLKLQETMQPFTMNIDQLNAGFKLMGDILEQVSSRLEELGLDIRRRLEPSQEEKDTLDALLKFTQGR